MSSIDPILQITDVEKRFQGLRPLRIKSLTVADAERVAVLGLDGGASEVLLNLVTGAGVPDKGVVRVQGHATADIADGDEWLASLDRFGIVSERAVLLEGATVLQNLAMPFTLQVDPVAPDVAARVEALALATGLDPAWLSRFAGDTPAEQRARVHLARAIALDPKLLILEHPTAGIPEAARAALGRDIVKVSEARRVAALILTQDQAFAHAVAHRTLKLDGATGALNPVKRGWFR